VDPHRRLRAIAVGTLWGGWKIIETMGLKITTCTPTRRRANIGAVTAIFGATGYGIPISTRTLRRRPSRRRVASGRG